MGGPHDLVRTLINCHASFVATRRRGAAEEVGGDPEDAGRGGEPAEGVAGRSGGRLRYRSMCCI